MKIVLILPSLSSGGLEKVITELAWYFSRQKNIQVYLISLSRGEFFYHLPQNIEKLMPQFSLKEMLRPFFLIRLFFWLRRKVRKIKPDSLLSFGGKFNSFVILSLFGLHVPVFISDRSRPSISYGKFLDWLNPIVYKNAAGIIAQTEKAKRILFQRTGHKNISVIGNPLRISSKDKDARNKIILNVGRFIPSKKQALLLNYFARINPEGWKLCFIGDGVTLNEVKDTASEMGLNDKVTFCGEVNNVEEYYKGSSIFAFTSVSEGFPNALGEAMAAGLACISFDCEAGPSDLITDGINGFLVPEYDHDLYIQRLESLIYNAELREDFGRKAKDRISEFSFEQIGNRYLEFFKRVADEDSD